jgi:hypothetical protein
MLGPERPVFVRRPAAAKSATLATTSAEQALAVRQFVARVGGLLNAQRAIDLLNTLSGAITAPRPSK